MEMITYPTRDVSSSSGGDNGSTPLGSILWFGSTTTVPDAYILCDGAIITDDESPLNGQTTPDLIGKVIKGGADVTAGTLQYSRLTLYAAYPQYNRNTTIAHTVSLMPYIRIK